MDKVIKEAIDALGTNWEAYKAANDARIAALAEGKSVVELEAKLAKIDAAMTAEAAAKSKAETEAKHLQDRIDALEAKSQAMGGMHGKANAIVIAKHADLFNRFIRSKNNNGAEAQALAAFERSPEAKAIDTTGGATGGYAVPEEISRMINEQEQLLSPVRSLVKVVMVGTPDYKELVATHGAGQGGWVGETGTRSATATPALRERAATFGMLYAYPTATEESVDDVFFNVGQFIAGHAGTAFAQLEGIACLTGNGTNKPTGMLAAAPTATDDGASPERAGGVLEYVGSGGAAVTADSLIDLVYTLRAGYRAGAKFAMNSLTEGAVRKLKASGTGEYLWSPGLAAGQASMLMGYGVSVWEDLASQGASAIPILFGNFMRGYVLADRVGTRVSFDEITTPGYVKWYIRRRVGGVVLDNFAIKALKCV